MFDIYSLVNSGAWVILVFGLLFTVLEKLEQRRADSPFLITEEDEDASEREGEGRS